MIEQPETGFESEPACLDLIPWFALVVRPRHEKSVRRILDYKGYRTSLPLQRCRHTRRIGTNWESEKPLISGYVFVRHHPDNPIHIVTTPGVLHIVSFGGKPSPISERDIEALERIAASELQVAQWKYPQVGDSVRLVAGPLKGIDGVVMRASSATRLIVNVHMLQRSVAVEIDSGWVVQLDPPSRNNTVLSS